LTAVAPAGSAGTVDITVTSPAGTSVVTAADHFLQGLSPVPDPTGRHDAGRVRGPWRESWSRRVGL
jgi:hypothetical protein